MWYPVIIVDNFFNASSSVVMQVLLCLVIVDTKNINHFVIVG